MLMGRAADLRTSSGLWTGSPSDAARITAATKALIGEESFTAAFEEGMAASTEALLA